MAWNATGGYVRALPYSVKISKEISIAVITTNQTITVSPE
jgi:hypothetical protein